MDSSSTVFMLMFKGPDLTESLIFGLYFRWLSIAEVHGRKVSDDSEDKLVYVRHTRKVTWREWNMAVDHYNKSREDPSEHLTWVSGGLCLFGVGRYPRCSSAFKFIMLDHADNETYFGWNTKKKHTTTQVHPSYIGTYSKRSLRERAIHAYVG